MERGGIALALAGAALCAAGGTACALDACPVRVPATLVGDAADAQATAGRALGAGLMVVGFATLAPWAIMALWAKMPRRTMPREMGYLYVSHFMSAWGDRMWQMAVPMIFMDMFKDTLLPTSVYSLVVYLVVVQFLPALGAWIDASHRLTVQQWCIVLENLCIISTSIIICAVVAQDPSEGVKRQHLREPAHMAWFAGLVLLGCAGELLNGASTVSLERDWVVVLARETGVPVTDINTLMRRIDLGCKALSPAAFAAVYQLFGDETRLRLFFGAAMLGVWNLLSFPLELMLLRRVFFAFPGLDAKVHTHADNTKHAHKDGHRPHAHIALSDADGAREVLDDVILPPLSPDAHAVLLDAGAAASHASSDGHGHGHSHSHSHGSGPGHGHSHGHREEGKPGVAISVMHEHEGGDRPHVHVAFGSSRRMLSRPIFHLHAERQLEIVGCAAPSEQRGVMRSLYYGMAMYWAEPVFLASVAYTLLYMTVLDNGALMTSYLEWTKTKPIYFGLGRGVGALFGLVGTFAYPAMAGHRGEAIVQAGLRSVWLFWLTLLPAGLAMAVAPRSVAAEALLISCVAVSRTWLWAFDLAITELCQRHIAEERRGAFGTVQTASYQLFFVVIQCAGIVNPDPAHFERLVDVSLLVVLAAAVLYTRWSWRFQAEAGTEEAQPLRRQEEEGGTAASYQALPTSAEASQRNIT